MAINCNANTAAPATATATAATTFKKVTIDRPPPMLPHAPNEFKFAERVLQKMVLDSQFFPKRAASNDWFKSIDHRPNRGKSGSQSSSGVYYNYNAAVPSQTRTPAVVEPIKRRSSRSAAVEDASSVATASTSNSVSSSEQGNASSSSPFPRRKSLADLSLLDQERLDMPFAIRVSDNSGSNNSSKKKEYAPILSVHEKNIHYGKLLGTGGFCEVRLASLKTKDCRTKADR